MLVTLNEVLQKAKKEKYAVGLFNTIDTDMLEGVISAAESTKSPVIIGTAEVLLPYGELKLIAPSVISAAKRASVPVVVHFDHGLTFGRCIEALKLGFSSVMFDGSLGSEKENLESTREMVKIAHAFGASVEGEIGHVGQADHKDDADRYTTVSEAVNFAEQTGVDALAVAIGTAHGAYKQKPKLDFKRLGELSAAVKKPLVLHGGSGLSDDDFVRAVAGGIAKINIFTDLCLAGERAVKNGVEKGEDYLNMRARRVEAIAKAAEIKMKLFGCCGKG